LQFQIVAAVITGPPIPDPDATDPVDVTPVVVVVVLTHGKVPAVAMTNEMVPVMLSATRVLTSPAGVARPAFATLRSFV
jgi:hypothetical protein